MKVLSKLFTCAFRGVIAFVSVPIAFYFIKTFLSLGAILQNVATWPLGIGFMIEVLVPILYIVAGLAWVFAPLLTPDPEPTAATPYYPISALPKQTTPAAKPTKKSSWFS